MPAAFVHLPELPLTSSGKLDRKALPEPAGSIVIDGGEEARTPVEEIVTSVWEDLLNRPGVNVNDDFFDIGGHSLLATRLVSRLRDVLKVDVPLRTIFEYPTVTAMAAEIERKRGTSRIVDETVVKPVGRDRNLPLSFAQQRMWFLNQLEPDSSAYSIASAVRLTGVLRLDALDHSLREIARRHEVLRTRFEMRNGAPQQVIDEENRNALLICDLSELETAQRERRLAQIAEDEGARPFDLETGSVWRTALVRLGPQEHLLTVNIHHVASDGWSIDVFAHELEAHYTAYKDGESAGLPELDVQYADYAVCQRGWFEAGTLDRQLEYWRERLSDMVPLELPTDRPRPAVLSHRGEQVSFRLAEGPTSRLKQLSRREGVTLFMSLMAGFQALLGRYAGVEDIAVGTPIAGRNRAEMEGLIGFFVNTLIIRSDVGGNATVREFLSRVRETALEAYANQDLPFERLVEELRPERSLSHEPLFQVMLIFQNAPPSNISLPDLDATNESIHVPTAKFDLTLFLAEEDGELRGSFEYASDIFDRIRMERMAGHLTRLLEGMAEGADQQVMELPLLSPQEREQLVATWNATTAEYPREGVYIDFEEWARTAPDRVAAVYEGQQITYAELNHRANLLAWRLREIGVAQDERVALFLERGIEMTTALLAVLKAGSAYVPMDPGYPAERLAYMLHDSNARVVITKLAELESLPDSAVETTICLDRDWNEISRGNGGNVRSQAQPDNLAYVIYTSGSTGKPKGVAIERRSLMNFIRSMINRPGLTFDGILLAVTSLSFDISALEILLPLVAGARLVIASRAASADGNQLMRLLAESAATHMQATPVSWRLLVDSGWCGGRDFSVLSGGEALTRRLADELTARSAGVWNLYGPTETTIYSSLARVETDSAEAPIGRPVANTQLYLLDPRLEPVPVGVTGQLYIGGDGLARGYLGRPDLTAEKFLPDAFGQSSGERIYCAGDLAFYQEDGNVSFLGRADHQIKIRGHRIEPGEIEMVLAQHPQVKQCVVHAGKDVHGEKVLRAYVVRSGDKELSLSGLREYLSGKFPHYMAPAAFVELDRLPLTPNGKLDRKALPMPATAFDSQIETPRSPIAEIVTGIWRDVLGTEAVGQTQSFFDLGGHSLLAAQVMSRVQKTFRVGIPLRAFFEDPTVQGLVDKIERERRAGNIHQVSAIQPVGRDRELSLSFAQQRLWFSYQLDPHSAAYNIPSAVRLWGALDKAALEQSIHEVGNRHEVLRTRFEATNGRPLQVIDPSRELDVSICDLGGVEQELAERLVRQIGAEQAKQPFNLETGPVWRVALARLTSNDHVLFLTMHHVVSDGWSAGVLVKELKALYVAFREGRKSTLPRLPFEYADYAVWQREHVQGALLQRHLDYWRIQLAGLPSTSLPTDIPRSAESRRPGASLPFSMPADILEELERLSRREGATLFITMLAAFVIVLGRQSGQEDVVVGTDLAGRDHPEVEEMIGFFVNQAALRVNLTGDPSFREILRRVRQTVLDAFQHQEAPFEKIVEEVAPIRQYNRSPLFQVKLVLQNTPREDVQMSGISARLIKVDDTTSKFDLLLNLMQTADGLTGQGQYDSDLFRASTIRGLIQLYESVLRMIVQDEPLLDAPKSDLLRAVDEQAFLSLSGSASPVFVRSPRGAVSDPPSL